VVPWASFPPWRRRLGAGGVAASDAMVGEILLAAWLMLSSAASSSSLAAPKLSRLMGVLFEAVRYTGVPVAARWSVWSARLVS
jgi:hypothetical protein